MSVLVCRGNEPSLQTRRAHAYTNTLYRGVGCSWGIVGGGQSSSGLIKSSGDRGSVGCLPASLPTIFRSPALRMAVQLSLQIQIPAHDTDIYNCHSCLPKCETSAEQPNDFIFSWLSIQTASTVLFLSLLACSWSTLCSVWYHVKWVLVFKSACLISCLLKNEVARVIF